jgi:VCBS repeat-containing protein
MFVGAHTETGDERKAAAALHPHVIGNVQTAAGAGSRRRATSRATSTAAHVTAADPPSRARAGGFGMLWLTALTFSLVKEVQAADPNVTLLDDGSITYKDLEHGAFELVTKEVIPRYYLVDDPGQTIILRSQGSSVSVSQSTNSAARMAELQAAQQEALATYEKGLGSTGSSTPPPLERLPVEPINFIQTDESPPAQDLPALPGSIFASVPETIFGKLPPPPPTPPTLNAITGPTEIDTAVFDIFTATSGTFLASSPNSATLTFGINGGTAGNTAIDGRTYDVSKAGPYGTLYVDSTTGAYTFVPNNDAINALVAPTTTDFTITVSDGTLSANQPFTVAINGTNDAAIISGATNGAAVEAGGVANTALGALVATGTLTSTDVDDAPNTFAAISTPTKSAHGFGTFTMTAAGVWTYTVNNDNSAVQALNVGDKLTDSFTVTTIDGTPQVVTVTINGANDAAVISGITTGSVTEDSGVKCDLPTATGALTVTDVDNAPGFTAVNCPTASDAGYGTFTMTADGVWTYTLDDGNCAVQALNVGDTLTDTFKVTSLDGTAQLVTVTINGTNDAAIICGTKAGSVIEAGGAANSISCKPTATGTLTDTDVDNAPNTFTAIATPTASTGGYGTFTMTADGVWTYTLDNTNCKVQALNVCDKLTDCFTVTTIDGTPQVVTITINGANDAAIICGTTTGSVTEAGACTYGTPIATGTLTDTDVDNTPNTFTAVCAPKASEAGYGTFTMTADGVWTYKLDNANCEVQALNDCDTLTDCFKVTTIDGTTQVVTITINGADDTFHFKDKMSDVETADVIDLAEDIPTPVSPSENAAGTSAAPAISEAAQTIELSPQWHQAPAGHAQHDLIV